MGKCGGEFIQCQRFILLTKAVKVLAEIFIFLRKKGEEDFFLCLKIIVDRRARKRGLLPYFLQGDFLEAHRLVELAAGRNDFLFTGIGQFR